MDNWKKLINFDNNNNDAIGGTTPKTVSSITWAIETSFADVVGINGINLFDIINNNNIIIMKIGKKI